MIRVLFIGKKNHHCSVCAAEFITTHCRDATVCLYDPGKEALPDLIRNWEGDYIISYLNKWVLPEQALRGAETAAINFHPAPPEYPGSFPVNQALYRNATSFGVTCHHMIPAVDAGDVIAVERFPVLPDDTVATLLERAYAMQLMLFYRIADLILRRAPLPESNEQWTRGAYTRKDFEPLFAITPDMTREEADRRIRAVTYGVWRPYIEVHGRRFVLGDS